ncbi:SAM hydrolase/SAM-dependent halogenase family protein [Spirulina subsalsa]|uniref:SAM hydrolase/SAM-dependent halogenase family protein n=1 Tax=Spirulina subsalsa TaxID=54311 RepID=UPI0002EE1F90|nr:SAM-dependent chlorinase/fluorinase [Spirulina subsalsa]
MTKIRTIALLSDFGLQDVYVGVMKGAIAQINPHLTPIDITHQIPPQNIGAGRFCLMNAVPYFPPDTVYVAVVDPGVGSGRRSVAVSCEWGIFVAPDNGLLSGVFSLCEPQEAVELTNPAYWRSPFPSSTFHGRDIFAPIGAHLASGIPLKDVGTAINPQSLITLPISPITGTANTIQGCIQYIDYFGNLITNIPANQVQGRAWAVHLEKQVISTSYTYSDRALGEIVALIGSHGWVELAINGGNAQRQLQLDYGDTVTVVFGD